MLHPMLRLLDGSAGTSPELGDEVKVLQTILKQDGFAVDVDGVFGPETESAVKRFQAEHGVADDALWVRGLGRRSRERRRRLIPPRFCSRPCAKQRFAFGAIERGDEI